MERLKFMGADPVSRPIRLLIRHIDFAVQISQLEQLKQNVTAFERTAVTSDVKIKIPLRARLVFGLGRGFAQISCSGLAHACFGHLKAKRVPIRGLDVARASLMAKAGRTREAAEMLKEELRLFPGNDQASHLLQKLTVQLGQSVTAELDKIFPREFLAVYEKIRPYTMLSAARLLALYEGAKSACATGIPGNFVECGVAGGGSSAMMAFVIQKHSRSRRLLYAFDTYEGLPCPGPEDVISGLSAAELGWGEGTCAAPIASLYKIAEELGVRQSIVPVKGLFQDTLPANQVQVGHLALLHLDGDWYDSTKCILDNLYDQVVPNGYLQIDDYGCWEGCRKATDEFENDRGLTFTKQSIDSSGVCFRKPL